jgi:uncharacterized protein
VTVEIRPLGVKCNIRCQYCYQDPQRDAGNVLHRYDLEGIKRSAAQIGQDFSLFGGEPLLVPEEDLEDLFRFGLEKFGRNSIQTNASLLNDNHVRMFREYKVSVGISVDGPGELNDVRWAGTQAMTRDATEKTHAAVERLCREGLTPSLIVTLHRGNATADKLPVMHDWLRYVQGIGITSARLHVLEVEHTDVQAKYALSIEENLAALRSFAELERELTTLTLDVYEDMRRLLRGKDDNTTCIWNACDPYTTRAVQGIEGNGQRSNCGRTNKDGIDFVKADLEGFERYIALYHTPQEHGGCQGCRFFLMCKGQCPGTAIDGDWRNRTEHCGLWMGLLSDLESSLVEQGESPLSLSPRRGDIERSMVALWARGGNTTIAGILRYLDSGDEAAVQIAWHGDVPHGDSHGDHTDHS